MNYKTVSISKINFTNIEFRIGYKDISQKLIQSVKKNGIINPPILIQKKKDEFIIVSGFNRIKAACTAGMEEVSAVVFDRFDGNMYQKDMLRKSYYGELGPIGKIQCIDILIKNGHCNAEGNCIKFGITYLDEEKINKIISMDIGLLRYLDNKDAPVKLIITLLKIDHDFVQLISEWTKNIQIRFSNFKIIIDLCYDISKKEEWRNLFLKINNKVEFNTDDEIIMLLRAIRYPTVTRIEKEVGEICKKYEDYGISIIMPPSLEGNEINISCTIRRNDGGKSFEKALNKLMKGEWLELIKFL
jgi:hypothetical protein